ncbi:MAG: hypothetical protein GY928_08330 [Colwellia sp.]|nr:hypothetical protein [Colwellia sp.]
MSKKTYLKIPTKKNKNSLSSINKRLLECYKNEQPVLLYGKDTINRHRHSLILNVHELIWGVVTVPFEYFSNFVYNHSWEDIEGRMIGDMIRAMEMRNHEKIYKLLRNSSLPHNMHTRFDCECDDGKTIFERLTDNECFSQNQLIDYYISRKDNIAFAWGEIFRFYPDPLNSTSYSSDVNYFKGSIIWHPGLLFIDNLRCSNNDPEDYKYYDKIALILEKDKERYNRGGKRLYPQWIVAYAYDISTFPQYFQDQFELVSLDDRANSLNHKKTYEDLGESTLKNIIPKGTKWTDIEMSLTDKEYKTLDVSIKGGKPFTVNFREIGLENSQSHKPLKAWWVLMAFARAENNLIPSTGKKLHEFAVSVDNMVPSKGGTLFSHIKVLRDALKEYFKISEDPIPHSTEKGAYETLFRIFDKSYTEEYNKSTQMMKDVECVECGELIVKFSKHNIDDKEDPICDQCKDTSSDRASQEGTYNNFSEDD